MKWLVACKNKTVNIDQDHKISIYLIETPNYPTWEELYKEIPNLNNDYLSTGKKELVSICPYPEKLEENWPKS